MSSNCKIVKGMSIFAIVWGILTAVMGIVLVAGSAFAFGTPLPNGEDPVSTAQVLGITYIALGVLYVATGVLGVRGANRPAKLKPFIYLAALVVIVALGSLCATLAGARGGMAWPDILTAVVAFTAIVYASRAMKEADER